MELRHKHEFTEDEIIFFADRVAVSQTGRVLVSSFLVNKYRFYTADYHTENAIIRSRIIDLVSQYT